MSEVEGLLRRCAPQVLGALVRRYGHFYAAEDAVQEALLAAAGQWPSNGVPDNPRGWLIKVASRRLTDALRSEDARRQREARAAALTPRDAFVAPAAGGGPGAERGRHTDPALPVLPPRTVGARADRADVAGGRRADHGGDRAGVSGARGDDGPEDQPGQAEGAGVRFGRPDNWEERLPAVLQILYLVFNEGYTATSGASLQRADLAVEAIRLTRTVHRLLPADREVTGLLALMLLTDARRAARTDSRGELVPLDEQDRGRWDRAGIAEGVALVTRALAGARGRAGPYQVRAAIAAVHDEADSYEATDWREILGLYDVLVELVPGPVERLSRVVALSMVRGPRAGLAALEALGEDVAAIGHRVEAVRGHLLERAGETEAARAAYESAARRTLSLPEQRYLSARAARLTQ